MKIKEQMKNRNVRLNFNKRIETFNNDIKTNEKLYEKTNSVKFLSIANNLRARRGELEFILKTFF